MGRAKFIVFPSARAASGVERRTALARFLRTGMALLVAFVAAMLTPANRAQDLGSTVRIVPVPDGAYIGVDGQLSNHTASFNWVKGSKHVLSVQTGQTDLLRTTNYGFDHWEYNGKELTVPATFAYTADPGINELRAVFQVEYAINVLFFLCDDAAHCQSPGIVYAGKDPKDQFKSDGTLFKKSGEQVTLVAVPNDGFVFVGWEPGPNQVIQGILNTVTMKSATNVYPRFTSARRVTLNAVPANTGLKLLADRSLVDNPAQLDWGLNTLHTLGVVSPQQDMYGKWWAFSSWSDGGASTHAYQVGANYVGDTVTATFVPVAVTAITTVPPGLKIQVDGRDNWFNYNFPWGIGETHKIEAPAQQTDDEGRIWNFDGWSQGGAAAQSFTVPASAESNGVRLIATYQPVGRLMISSSLAGLSVDVDGAECRTPCDLQRPFGSTVKVSTQANVALADGVRADFTGWPGSGSLAPVWSVKLGSDVVKLRADYQIMNRLLADANPPEGVRWKVEPNSADGYYEAATPVSVSVSAQPGYKFRGWNGDLSGIAPSGVVAMTGPRAVHAMLDRVPYIAPSGVGNAAASIPRDGVAPGSVISIFGVNLTTDQVIGPDNPLVQTLGGVTVRMGERFLPLFFVSPSQINAQAPADLGEGLQSLSVSAAGLPEVRATFNLVRNAPGIFAQVFHEDGSPVNADSPARRGEMLTIYGTGFGPTDRPRPLGFAVPASPVFAIVDAVRVTVGDTAVDAESAVAAAGRVGLDLVKFRLREDAPAGTEIAVFVNVNGQDSNTIALPIQ